MAKMSVLKSSVNSDRGAVFLVTPRRSTGLSRKSVCTCALFSKKQKQAAPNKVADTP